MKFINIALFFISVFVLTACPSSKPYEDAVKKLHKNRMDLPNPILSYHDGIRFKVSELFEENYSPTYVLKDDATTGIIYDLDLNFSVESFTKAEAEAFQFAFSDSTDLLNSVHDQYVLKRENSLFDYKTSIKKSVPKTVGFTGIIQTIQGATYEFGTQTTYLMSTIEIGDKFYVFQLIGVKHNMGHLYDDFLDILNSIEK